jgi:hypothetical protein
MALFRPSLVSFFASCQTTFITIEETNYRYALDGGSDDVYYSHSSGTMSERSMDSITFENNRDIITKIYVYGCQILFQKSLRRHDKIKKALFFYKQWHNKLWQYASKANIPFLLDKCILSSILMPSYFDIEIKNGI